MTKLIAFLAVAVLAGCSTVTTLDHGSWLDEVGMPPQPPLVMSDEQAGYMMQEAAQLRARSEALRARLAHETDRRQRFRHYEALRDLGDELAPVERALRDAGRPVRSAGTPPQAA
jgi:hypothetical protein